MQKNILITLVLLLGTLSLVAQEKDQAKQDCNVNYDELEVDFDRATGISTYKFNGELFTGCVNQDVSQNKIYYLHYVKDGKLQRQIGYYYNGEKCRDFNYKDGVAHGTLELYYTNGTPYIREEYLNGKLHGDLKRWKSGKLVREAKFWYGTMISEQLNEVDPDAELTEEEKRLGGTNC